MAQPPFVIALDGPAASGKSTVGSGVAEALGFFYFDTGVLYRALTCVALNRGIAPTDAAGLAQLARGVRFEVGQATVQDGRQLDVRADGEDVSLRIRTPAVDASVSAVSAHAAVRDALIQPQRDAVCPPGTVLAGRDIGTVIVPDAPLKIWLDASAEERARRRAAQHGDKVQEVLRAMVERDRFDSSRAVAPMVKASDAVRVRTDGVPAEEVVRQIVALARGRMAAPVR